MRKSASCRFIKHVIYTLTTALIFLMHYPLGQQGTLIWFTNEYSVHICLFQINVQSYTVGVHVPSPLCQLQGLLVYSLSTYCVICLLAR